MINRLVAAGAIVAVAFAGLAFAQQYPLMDALANRVVQKYQSESCEEIMANRAKAKSPEEERVIAKLRSDPQMQQAFLNKVAAPIANKMFSCGLIP
ncbi:MAG: hypothetical protein ACREPX_01055 [Rhodanobacteraceae bacterium]